MKSPRQHVWKWRIALMILVAWIGLDGVAIITMAQVRPPRRKRRVMISPDNMRKKDETTVDIGKSLVEIAQRASRQSMNRMVDLAFVIDGSVPMEGSARIVEERIADMAGIFAESAIDYRFALIWFQNADNMSQITVKPLQGGLNAIEDNFFKIVLRGKFKGDAAGYGLDAIIKGLNELKFRWDAEKHFIIVTNSELKTAWGEESKKNQVIGKILDWCQREEIRINVIGIGEEIQLQLADLTDGKWYAIDKRQRKVDRVPLIDKSILKIDGIFRRIAQHIAETVKQPADMVFIYDSSLSMDNKVDEICTGLGTLVKVLDSEGLDYRFGVIRFWAQSGGGESSITITRPPLNVEQVKKLFQRPRRGDEHLLDAIMEGVPKLQTPDNRKLVLFIITDEPSSSGPRTGYTYAKAVEVCRHANAQVNAIGGIAPMGGPVFSPVSGHGVSEEFQRRAPASTNGKHYIMPGTEVLFQSRLTR